MQDGIHKLADAVGVTLGPRGALERRRRRAPLEREGDDGDGLAAGQTPPAACCCLRPGRATHGPRVPVPLDRPRPARAGRMAPLSPPRLAGTAPAFQLPQPTSPFCLLPCGPAAHRTPVGPILWTKRTAAGRGRPSPFPARAGIAPTLDPAAARPPLAFAACLRPGRHTQPRSAPPSKGDRSE